MTLLDEEPRVTEADGAAQTAADHGSDGSAGGGDEAVSELTHQAVAARPLLVAGLSSTAAALTTGGIFGSWPARMTAVGAALLGVGWCFLTLRSIRRRLLLQLLLMPVMLAVAAAVLLPGAGGNASFGGLISDAIRSGRLFRPPVPFDPGWRPILVLVFVSIGYAAAWVGTALERPLGALAMPGVVIALTAITQPPGGQLLTAILAATPLVAALAVMFGGDARNASQLGRSFELRRAARAIPAFAVAIVLLVVLNNSSFLFPKPVYNPQEKPQKPRSIPLSQVQNTVLFTVDGPITGPWQVGTLDVYQDGSFLLPPYNPSSARKIAYTGDVVDKSRKGTVTVKFVTGDLGDTSVLPGLVDPTDIDIVSAPSVVYDRVTQTFRVPSGRVPKGSVYTESIPAYPNATQLTKVGAIRDKAAFATDLHAPSPPASVRLLLAQAPTSPWARLDFLRNALLKVVVANGAGIPQPVTPVKVNQMLVGNHLASPYDIVAAEVLLARWAGIPARIGFGFDGKNLEGNVYTVRPKNSAQWLEAYFPGYGWVPVVGTPPHAQANLNNNKNTQISPTIQASNNIAVELYIPVDLPSLQQLYQEIRNVILMVLPWAALALLLYLLLPWAKKTWRSSKRRRWAASLGPRAQIAVEYAELRDWATDLGVGDPLAGPLEYLEKVVYDEQHLELAWLVSRTLYGDMGLSATADDVEAARDLSASLRRRLFLPQPTQTKILALIARASLSEPFTDEVPNVGLWKLPRVSRLRRDRRRRTRPHRRPFLSAVPRVANPVRWVRRSRAPVSSQRER